MGSGRGQISAYPRQLESLIRLAEAHARMRLSETVEVEDVQEARRLVVGWWWCWHDGRMILVVDDSNVDDEAVSMRFL